VRTWSITRGGRRTALGGDARSPAWCRWSINFLERRSAPQSRIRSSDEVASSSERSGAVAQVARQWRAGAAAGQRHAALAALCPRNARQAADDSLACARSAARIDFGMRWRRGQQRMFCAVARNATEPAAPARSARASRWVGGKNGNTVTRVAPNGGS